MDVAAKLGFGAEFAYRDTEAIFEETEVPEKWAEYTELNAKLSADWPVITEKKDALPDADDQKDVEDKRDKLSEEAFSE